MSSDGLVKQDLWFLGVDIYSSKSCFLNNFDAISTNVDFLSTKYFFFTGKNLQELKMNQAQSVKVHTKWMTNIRNNQEQLTHISILTQKLISSFKKYLNTSNYEK